MLLQRESEPSVLPDEYTFLKSVIDLALARRPPSQSRGRRGDEDEYLPLSSIISTHNELAHQLKISPALEERTYQLLLLMSAEEKLTWWEKVQKIPQYLKALSKKQNKSSMRLGTSSISPDKSRFAERTNTSYSLGGNKTVTDGFLRVSNQQKKDLIGRISTTAPSDLEEGAELSFLLNQRIRPKVQPAPPSGPASSATDLATSYAVMTTPIRGTTSHSIEEKISSIEKETKVTQGLLSNLLHRFDQVGQPNFKPPDSTGKDHPLATLDHTMMANHNPLLSPVPKMMQSGAFADTFKLGSPELSVAGDDTGLSTIRRLEARRFAANPTVQDFSKSLKRSTVMSKYLNSQKKKLNRSQDDVDKEENAESGIRITSEDLTLRDISPSKQGTFTASQLHSSPGKRMTKTQRNITFADFDEKEGMPADVEQERGNNTAEPFSSPKGRQSSIDIISSLQSPNSQRKKFEMNAFLKELTIDPSYLPLEEQDPSYHQHHPLSDGTKSSIKLLILFQQYVLAHSPNPLNHSQPSKHRHDHQQSSRILPLQFYHHLTDLSPFVSSLFGLEQWIRDKMKEFVSREALRQIFVFWSLDSGVNTIGRQYYRKSLLRKGLEYFMEYNVKSRLRRKSILKLYMWRRIQLTGGEGGSHYQHNSSVTKGLSTGMALFTSSENRSYRNMMTNMSPSLHKSKHSANVSNMSRFGTSSRKNVFYYQDDEEDAEKTKGDNRSFDKSDFLVDNITMLSPSKKRLSTSDLGMTSTGQNPPTAYAQRYSTSLSLRHLLHQAQYSHHTLYRDMINVGVAGGGNQQNIGHVRHADYLYAQDLIALLFAFRRFYRRTIDLKHYRRIRQLHNTRTELGIFQLWHEYYQKRKVNQQVFEPFIIQLQHESYERRKKEAFYTLLRNVTINKQRQTLYKQLKEKIYKKKIFIQAAMMMGYPYYIRCFLRWKRTYDGLGGITRHRQEMINDFYYSYKRRRFLMKWHDRIISLKRKNLLHIMRMKDLKIVTSLHYLYVPSFLLLSQHKDHQRRGSRTKEGGGGGVQSGVLDHHHGSVETKHLRSHLIKYGIQLSYMKRFLLRWKKRVLLTKLWYPSFIEMKFHYLYMRFSNDLLSTSEKLQYRKLINKMRSVMFLRQIDYFSHRFDSQQQAPLPSNSVFPSSDGSMVNENYSNSFAAAKEKEKEYYLLMNHYFHRQEIEQRRIREGENDEEESVRSTSQRQWMMFTSSALTSSPLLYTSEYDVAVAMSGGDVSISKSHQHQHHSMKYIHYFLSYYYQKLYLYHYNPHYTNYFNTILQPQLRERERLKEQEKEREQMRLATAGLKSAPNIISSTSSEPSQVPAPSTKNQQHLPFGEYLSMFSQPASHRNLTIDTSSTKNSTFATSNQSYDMIAIFSIYIRRWKYHAALRVHSKTKALQLKKKRLLKIFFAWREHYHLVHTVAMIQKRRHWQRWKQFRFSHRIFTKRSSYKVNDYLRQKAMNQWKHYLNYHYDNSVQQNQSFYNHMIQTVPLKKYDYIVYKMRKHLKDNENNYFYSEYEKFLFYVEGKLLFHQFSLPPPIIITPRVQRSSSLSPSNRGKTSPRAGGSPPTPRRMMKSNKQTLRIFIDTVMKEEKQGGEEGVGGGNSSSVNYSSSFFPSSYNNNQQEKFISAKLLKRYLLSLLQQYSQSSSGLSRLMKVTRQRHQMRVAKQRASSFKLYHGLHHFMNYHYFGKLRKAVRQLKMKKVLLTWKGELLRHRITIPRMTTDAFRQFRHHYKQRVYYRVYKALIRDKYEYVFRRLLSHVEDCHSKEKRLSEYQEQKRLLTAWAEWQQLFYMNMLYKRKMMLKSLSYYHHQLYPLQQLKNHNHYLLTRVYLPSKYFHKLLKNIYLKKKYYHLLEVYGQLYYLQRLRIYCFNNLYQIITRKRQKKFLLNDSEVKTLNLPNMKNLLLQEVFAWKEKEFYRYQKVYWKTQEINHPKKISLLTINRMKNKKKKILTLIHKYSNYCRYSYLFQPSYTLLTSNLTSIQWKKKLFRLSTFSSSLTMDFHQQLLAQQEQQQAQSKGKNKANNKTVGKGIPSLTQQPTLPMSPLSPLVRGGLGSPMSALRRELFDDFAADGEEDVLQGGAKSPTVPWNYRQTQPPQLHPLLPLNVSAITTAPLTYDRKKGSTGERRDRGGDAGAADRAYELYSQSVLTKYDTSGISVKQSVGGGQVSLKDEFDEDEREDNDDVLDEQIRSFHSHSRTHSPAGRSKNPVGEDGDDLPPPPSYQHLLNQTTSTSHTLKTTISQKSGRRQRFNSDSSTDVKDQIHDDNDHGEEVVRKGSIVIPTSSIKREIAVTEDDHFDYDDQEEGQSDNEDDYYQDGDDEIRPQIGLSKTFPTTSSKSRHGNKTAALARALTPTRSRPPSTRHTPSHPDVIVPTSISFEARFSEDSVMEGEEEDGDDRLNHTAMSRLTSSLSRSTTIDRLKKKDTMASENERDKLNIQTTLPSMTSAPSSHRSRRTSSTSPPRSTSTVGRRVPSEPPPSSDLRGRRMNETLNLSTLTTPSPHQPPPSTSNKKSLKLDLTPRYFDDTQPAIPQSSSILHPPFTSPMASAAPLTMSALLNRSDSVRPPPLTTATLKSALSPTLKQPSSVQTSRPPTGRGPASRPEPLQSFSPLRSPQPPPLSSLTGVAGGGLTRGEGFFFPKTPDSRNDADSTVMTSDTYSTHYPQSPNPSSPARLTRSQSQNQSRSQNQSQSQYRTTSQTFFNATPSNYLDGGVEDDAFTSTAMLAEQIANYHQTVRQVLRCSPRHNLRLLKHLLATTTQTPEDDASPYHPLIQKRFFLFKLLRRRYYRHTLLSVVTSHYLLPKYQKMVLKRLRQYALQKKRRRHYQNKRLLVYALAQWINRMNEKKSQRYLTQRYAASFHLIVSLTSVLRRWRKVCMSHDRNGRSAMERAIYFHHKRRLVTAIMCWKAVAMLTLLKRRRGGDSGSAMTLTTRDDDTLSSVTEYHLQSPRYPSSSFYNSGRRAPERRKIGDLMDFYHSSAMKRQKRRKIRNFDGDKDDIAENEEQATSVYQRFLRQTQRQSQRYQSSRILSSAVKGEGTGKERRRNSMKGEAEKEISDVRDRRDRSRERERRDNIGRVNANADSLGSRTKELMKQRGISTPKVKSFY